MAEDLYERDFYTWTLRQAEALRAGDIDRLDRDNLAEEIETLGRSEAAALKSAYRLIAMHFLKIMFQPARRTASWDVTVQRERLNVEDILDDNSGLKRRREALFARAYALARKEAAIETALPLNQFPKEPPFAVDAVESSDFWPDGSPAADGGA
jgi:hypothetical protein